MFRLFTTYYEDSDEVRQRDLDLALGSNCDSFNAVYVLSQAGRRPEAAGPNCEWIVREDQQKLSQLLDLACANTNDGDVAVIANSDILVPGWTLRKINSSLQPNEVFALSRWDILSSGIHLYERRDSQDAWAFRGPPKPSIGGDYVAAPGIDNHFAAELSAAGYTVLNPARDVVTYHVHMLPKRNCNDPKSRIPLPYLFVSPSRLGESPQYHKPTRASKQASSFQR